MRPARRPTSTDRGRPLRRAAVPVLAAFAAACAAFGGARPAFAPLPQAEVFASPVPVSVILLALRDTLTARGLTIQTLAPAEGYLETRWFDLRARASVPEPIADLDRIVKLRFFVDPVGLHSRVIAESVRRTGWDPSRPPRDLEAMLAADHPGRLLMDSVLAWVPRGTAPPPPTSTRTPGSE